MRLSTERDRDETTAIAVLHAALDAGVTLLDTADAYCWDDRERGHNERLIARALSTWPGDRSTIVVATKGGMTRPDGRWEPDGRAKHLTAACEASCRALGVQRLDLYQLHAPDPRVPFATSVRALASLKRAGLVERIGLCNVTVGQIEEARRIVDIDSIQVEVSLWQDRNLLSGVVRYCVANRLQLLAYRPLGGRKGRSRVENSPVLREIAVEHDATPFDVALAWVASLSEFIVPLPGPTRLETASSVGRYRGLELTEEQTTRIDVMCPAVRALRGSSTLPPSAFAKATADKEGGSHTREDAEVVLVMGLPGAGKSTLAEELAGRGYLRLNRDETGGTLRGLVSELDRALASGTSRIVLDNTYPSRASRAAVIQAAADRGVAVRCIWLSTSLADAQVNAVSRLVQRFGKLLDEEDMKAYRLRDPAALPPTALFRYQRELEPPDVSEGFSCVDVVPFERRRDPSHVNRAVIVWSDGSLDPRRAEALRRDAEQGYRLLGLSWQPGKASSTIDVLGLPMDVEYCRHVAGPPKCWCRKPLPGLGALLIHRHQLDPAACLYIGSGPHDAGYANRLGFRFILDP